MSTIFSKPATSAKKRPTDLPLHTPNNIQESASGNANSYLTPHRSIHFFHPSSQAFLGSLRSCKRQNSRGNKRFHRANNVDSASINPRA